MSQSAGWDGALGDHLLRLCLCPPGFLPLPRDHSGARSLGPPSPRYSLSPVGNLSQAVENVLSVLLFYPEDEAARKALDQYQAQLGEPRPALGPREVAPPHSPREVARNQTGVLEKSPGSRPPFWPKVTPSPASARSPLPAPHCRLYF